jgi:frataxin-like iron-binding protein CyaY
MKYLKTLSCVLVGLTLCSSALAQSHTDPGLKTYASLGYSAGGDVLVDGIYSNTGKPFTLRAGQGIQYMLGVQYQWANNWSAQAALGYHYDRTNGDGWNFKFTRYPVELMVHHALNDDWRVGLGARYSIDPTFKSLGTKAEFGNSSLNASPGAVGEIQYMLFPLSAAGPGRGAAGGISLKWAQERFRLNGVNSLERNGQHVALSIFTYF